MSRNPWAIHNSVFDTSVKDPYIGRRPSDAVVRAQTQKYIVADFYKNGHKYAEADYVRVHKYIEETSALKAPLT